MQQQHCIDSTKVWSENYVDFGLGVTAPATLFNEENPTPQTLKKYSELLSTQEAVEHYLPFFQSKENRREIGKEPTCMWREVIKNTGLVIAIGQLGQNKMFIGLQCCCTPNSISE